MKTEQFAVPVGWGSICGKCIKYSNLFNYLINFNWKFELKGQIFGEKSEMSQPIVLIHGYLDNTNS